MNKKIEKVSKKNLKSGEEQLTKKNTSFKKMSEYGKQLAEKQKVKKMYGVRERQFRKFFDLAKKSKEATGSNLLVLLERRLDNVVFRLKFASTRAQARQMVVHGHFLLNKKRVYSPSILTKEGDIIEMVESSLNSEKIKDLIIKNFSAGIKIPMWLEIDNNSFYGRILRKPERTDIQATIQEGSIVELYSK